MSIAQTNSAPRVWIGHWLMAVLALLALAVTTLERARQTQALNRVGLGTLVLAVVGVVLMPASGFWLAIPAGIAMVRRGR